MKKILFILFAILVAWSPPVIAKDVSVRGHGTKRGTYVMPHHRTTPGHNPYKNWSTKGNVNPYTGKPGTKNPN